MDTVVVWALIIGVAVLFAFPAWYARRAAATALGEVRDFRYQRGLWRLSAARLIVRPRTDDDTVRILYRASGTTMRYSCSSADAKRIASALREAAHHPLAAPGP